MFYPLLSNLVCYVVSRTVAAVNSAITSEEDESLLAALTSADLNIHSVTGDCIPTYMEALKAEVEESSKGGWN